MGFWDGLLGRGQAFAETAPRASVQSDGPGTVISTPQQLEEALRYGNVSFSGEAVTPDRALAVAAAYGCVRLISGAIATLPLQIKRRVDDRTRADASDDPTWKLMRKPNRWQKPHQFKRMMQAHVLLRGNAYALKVPGVRGVQELIPLHPDRVSVRQRDDWTVEFFWTRKNGSRATFEQDSILHLYGLTLDGFTGVTPITYARETLGTSLSMDRYVARTMANGARVSGVAQTKEKLSDKAYDRLKESLGEFRAGEEREGDFLLLEEGLEWKPMSLSIVDMEWIEARKLTRSDVCMFYGVPPSMIGDNSGSDSNWGTGLEQKSNGFQAYSLEDHLTMWEEGISADVITQPDVYARFNRAALVRSDIRTRWGAHVQSLQWGVMSPNEVRALEDMNPREGGDIYYPPPNTAGKNDTSEEDDSNDPNAPPKRNG